MEWRNILKAPMPLDTRDNRDEQFKQAIIDYEKNIIEPKLTEHFSSNEAAENKDFSIIIASKDSAPTEFKIDHGYEAEGPAFIIGGVDSKKLGGNSSFIKATISKLYTDEGWTARQTGYGNVLTLRQPSGA